ncbi:MAG: M48 family metallopeptidase [Anaeroplasmataceae bacterium]
MEINFLGYNIKLELIIKRSNKYIYYRYKDGKIIITSPKVLSRNQIIEMLEKNKNKLAKLINNKNNIEISNTIHYLGREYEVEIIEANEYNVYLTCDRLVIKTKNVDDLVISKLIHKFYTIQAGEYISKRFDMIFTNYSDLKITKPKLVFKYTKTFFGKCYPKRNMITFSGICMKYDTKYIDCIINHELCHFKYLGHQNDFYKYFDSHFYNAKQIQKELRSLKYKDKY